MLTGVRRLMACVIITLFLVALPAAAWATNCVRLPDGSLSCEGSVSVPGSGVAPGSPPLLGSGSPTPAGVGSASSGGSSSSGSQPVEYQPTAPPPNLAALLASQGACAGAGGNAFGQNSGQGLNSAVGPCATGPATTPPAAAGVPAAPAAPLPPSPAQLAAQAYAQIRLQPPAIGSAPCSGAGCMGAVGVPVWLWTRPWTPQSATAAAAGVSVTVSAKVDKVTWSMGDGNSVVCATPGTAFSPSMGFKDSPDCGYRYQTTSANQPGLAFIVTAVEQWVVTFSGAYAATENVTTRASTALTVGEYQVLVTS